MPRLKQKYKQPLREVNQQPANVLQNNRIVVQAAPSNETINSIEPTGEDLSKVSSILDDENCQPGTSSGGPTTSALYQELNSFRQRWKRELEVTTNSQPQTKSNLSNDKASTVDGSSNISDRLPKESKYCDKIASNDASSIQVRSKSDHSDVPDGAYAEAKRLFLIAVDLEGDDMHHESICYYKKAMHLCPDIEKQIFREQCEASVKAAPPVNQISNESSNKSPQAQNQPHSDVSLFERILHSYQDDGQGQKYSHCRFQHKVKLGTLHISDLPHELMAKIIRHVVGDELDLASLELTGMVCRGFFIMSRDRSLWRDICISTWGPNNSGAMAKKSPDIDWRQMFLERPRVNFDGVYISRTRYFRQGDVGFQDITYRPFHVVRYYRYLRFFPDRRVLILTTNEEPDKIVPIFRHALNAKQFSPELSVMEGTYEFSPGGQICITADKKCRKQPPSQGYRRHAQMNWSRQTPISQKFNLKFELKTVESKPYRNNVLKWLAYSIESKLETGLEVTTFDMCPDTFPNLIFSRVKRFNLRSENPLSSH